MRELENLYYLISRILYNGCNQDSVLLTCIWAYGSVEQTTDTKNSHSHIWLFFNRAQGYSTGKIVISINGARTTGYPYVKTTLKNELEKHEPAPELNVKATTIKLWRKCSSVFIMLKVKNKCENSLSRIRVIATTNTRITQELQILELAKAI